MVVIISELGVVRMRRGRVLRVLLGDVVDFRIGDRVLVHPWLELEGGMILVAARRLSERDGLLTTNPFFADVDCAEACSPAADMGGS